MPAPKHSRSKRSRSEQQEASLAPPQSSGAAFNSAMHNLRTPNPAFPNVSARWLLSAGAIVFLGALVCAWLTLCLLYWQGSWQLLYHPKAAIVQTPANVGLPYETIHFAATETGQTQLTGWWIPNETSKFTALYLHGADGNMGDSAQDLAALHPELAIFAIDYRGYGQSAPARPNEKQLRQDAEWTLTYLTLTRHIDPKHIVVYGTQLGANLALELAADHKELAGAILDQPLEEPLAPLFKDARSHMVPAHALVADSYALNKPAKSLQIPSLWLIPQAAGAIPPNEYKLVEVRKTQVFLNLPFESDPHYSSELKRWLDDLAAE